MQDYPLNVLGLWDHFSRDYPLDSLICWLFRNALQAKGTHVYHIHNMLVAMLFDGGWENTHRVKTPLNNTWFAL